MNELALFAGAGGGILASKLLGYKTVCAVERDAYAASVLAQRQNDRSLPPFPIWSDITTFDGHRWRGVVDLVSGGFPCQDISIAAGDNAEGITGERSGLWKEMARIVGEVQPREVFVENSPMLAGRGLDVVLGDLACMGFDAAWGVLGAHHFSAPHQRDRMWIYAAHTDRDRHRGEVQQEPRGKRQEAPHTWGYGEIQPLANANREHAQRFEPELTDTEMRQESSEGQAGSCSDGFRWWSTEPAVGRVADGVAYRVDRIKCIGNGQVPIVAATAFQLLKARLENEQLNNWLPW